MVGNCGGRIGCTSIWNNARRERAYVKVVAALSPVLHGLPPKIIGIGGRPGVGKTPLGRYLACTFNVSLLESDLFLIDETRGTLAYRNKEVAHVIAFRINRCERPIIVEGAVVLRLLDEVNRKPDFTIYIKGGSLPGSETLRKELKAYETEFSPEKSADFVFTPLDDR